MPQPRITFTSCAIAALFLLAYLALGSRVAAHALQGDFASLYMGASLVRDGQLAHLYQYPTQAARWQQMGLGDVPPVPYVRPPFYAILQSLIAWVPLLWSYWLCTAVSIGVVGCCWIWAGRRLGDDCLILAAMFLPPVLGIAHGQDCALMLLLAAVSFWLYDRQRETASGAFLALGLFKFHLLLLIGPLLLLTRRWRMLQGFVLVGISAAVLSFVLVGVSGFYDYVSLLFRRDLSPLYPAPEKMPNLAGLLANLSCPTAVLIPLGSLALLALAGCAAYHAPWWRLFAAGIAASLLLIPHVFVYDITVLLPSLLYGYAQSSERLTRAVCVWLCCPIPYLAALLNPPWPAVLPASLLMLLTALVWEAYRASAGEPLHATGATNTPRAQQVVENSRSQRHLDASGSVSLPDQRYTEVDQPSA